MRGVNRDKKNKANFSRKERIRKLKIEIQKYKEKSAWEEMAKGVLEKSDFDNLMSRLRRRYEIRREILMDKYLVTLRPWANRFKNKRPKGLGWLDDA